MHSREPRIHLQSLMISKTLICSLSLTKGVKLDKDRWVFLSITNSEFRLLLLDQRGESCDFSSTVLNSIDLLSDKWFQAMSRTLFGRKPSTCGGFRFSSFYVRCFFILFTSLKPFFVCRNNQVGFSSFQCHCGLVSFLNKIVQFL